ncbi:hypothetical protein DM860_014865 [Cuscuta australis]|uniref:DUF7865 domain-containing protein n=1 Tax=Cuscuta australis TaxID=267555 RepID=A0A328DJ54_9ASTE|nr:hypothetical protein DM860_014865 [Cuscuta australis]
MNIIFNSQRGTSLFRSRKVARYHLMIPCYRHKRGYVASTFSQMVGRYRPTVPSCGALMMFYSNDLLVFSHGRERASKLLGSTPHDQLIIQTSDSFSGLLLFAIGFLLFMVAFSSLQLHCRCKRKGLVRCIMGRAFSLSLPLLTSLKAFSLSLIPLNLSTVTAHRHPTAASLPPVTALYHPWTHEYQRLWSAPLTLPLPLRLLLVNGLKYTCMLKGHLNLNFSSFFFS